MSLDNTKFYENAYEKHGVSARGVNWNSQASQEIRFEIITNLLSQKIATCEIVDAGCGFGELYLFWKKRGLIPKEYIGIDCVQNSIDISKRRFEDFSHCNFTCKDILKDDLPLADWYVASGSLNILNNFDTWLFLEKILACAKKGIIFNILKGYVKSDNFNYRTKEDIINFAKTKGLEAVTVEGYLKNDITVKILKAEHENHTF